MWHYFTKSVLSVSLSLTPSPLHLPMSIRGLLGEDGHNEVREGRIHEDNHGAALSVTKHAR